MPEGTFLNKLPDKKYFIGAAVGAVLTGGVAFAAVASGAFDKQFVPSKETCTTFFETRNGRQICLIYVPKAGEEALLPGDFKHPPTKVKEVKKQKVKKPQEQKKPLYTPRYRPW